jgi:hypothetical protein
MMFLNDDRGSGRIDVITLLSSHSDDDRGSGRVQAITFASDDRGSGRIRAY